MKFGAVGLGVVVLVEQFGEQEVGVMAVVFRGRAGIETGNEARQGGVGLLLHQAVDGQQFGRRRFGRLNDLQRSVAGRKKRQQQYDTMYNALVHKTTPQCATTNRLLATPFLVSTLSR